MKHQKPDIRVCEHATVSFSFASSRSHPLPPKKARESAAGKRYTV